MRFGRLALGRLPSVWRHSRLGKMIIRMVANYLLRRQQVFAHCCSAHNTATGLRSEDVLAVISLAVGIAREALANFQLRRF
jgi:hypothetical protein